MSFLGWWLLELVTLGLSAVFYSNAYRTAAFCEYYTYLRNKAKEKGIPNSELLNDKYLFEKADKQEIERYQTEQLHIQAMKNAADGISYPTRLSRMNDASWAEMVGLQRLLSEYPWQNLRRRPARFWCRRAGHRLRPRAVS